MLEIKKVTKSFGGVTALREVSLNVKRGEISAIIGPNGAGKTTLLNIISGTETADRGEIFFNGQNLNSHSPVKIARKGISRTFQHLELFGEMTVIENIMVGRYSKTRAGFFSSGLKLPFVINEESEIKKKSEEILDYIKLTRRRDESAGNLPIGEQRIMEMGRALATEPKLLLLDEPAAGLNIRETRNLGDLIKRLRDERGITIILVEHDMDLVMRISERVTVLSFGEVIAEGTPLEIQKNPAVIAAYLGVEEET